MARRYMGEMSPEEFRRKMKGEFFDEELEDLSQRMKKHKQKGGNRKEAYEASSENPYWENPLDRLMWKTVYDTRTATFVPDYVHNRLKIIVKEYHQQEYNLDAIVRDYLRSLRSKGYAWRDIGRCDVATGKDFTLLFKWLIETGQFPYPYEVAVGVRHHYIDMKQIL